jgi:hypothetical protein
MKGVAFNHPPDELLPSIEANIARAIEALPAGASGALVGVVTEAGVNAAIVTRPGKDWTVSAWVGKTWGASTPSLGAHVMKSW